MNAATSDDVLVVAPHPDDAAIGCGGTITKCANAGSSVTVVYATDGEMGSPDRSPEEMASTRREEASAGATGLGVDSVQFLGYPDGGISFSRETLQSFVNVLREEQPDVVYLPSPDDADHDHSTVAELGISALRKAFGPTFPDSGTVLSPPPRRVLAYEVWTPLSTPTTFESITDVLERKREAITCHESQLQHISYDEAILGLNRYRGEMSGTGQYAEAFRALRVDSG